MAQVTLLENEVDVLVIGGGTAGTIAAIQAARAGARTLLLEMGPQLGGVTTTGGVSFPGLFHAWGRQIIAGIGWELVKATSDLEDRELPDFSVVPERHWHHQVRINGQLYAALAEEACLAAGVELGYYEFPADVQPLGEGGRDGYRLRSFGKGLERTVRCRQLIDATGGADVVGMLGLPRLRGEQRQPGTLIFRFGGYDVDTLDPERIQQRYEQALHEGTLEPGDYASPRGRFMNFLRSGGDNAQHVFDADSSTAATKTQANIAGRRSALRLLRFIRSLPGCERARLERMQTETAVRETYRIVGRVQVTREDYVTGRCFDDAVCYAFYPVDLHTHEGVKPEPLSPGVVPTVPLRALMARDSENLLVAGRSISSDREANSGLRVQAVSMAMGQAAGGAAALAAQRGESTGDVSIDALRALLAEHGAIVPAASRAAS